MPLRWSGFADLGFSESALLAFARAAELAETDIHEQHPDAWIIDDRHIAFALETESGRSSVEAMQRFLGLLVLQAETGEATIEITEPRERWVRRAAPGAAHAASPEGPPESKTLRAADRPGSAETGAASPAEPRTSPPLLEGAQERPAPLPEGAKRPPTGRATG